MSEPRIKQIMGLHGWQGLIREICKSVESVMQTNLHLPREVVEKIYQKNAEKWIPGLLNKKKSWKYLRIAGKVNLNRE